MSDFDNELRVLLDAGVRGGDGLGSAALATGDRIAELLTSPALMGSFYKAALERAEKPQTPEARLLVGSALVVYERAGGLTSRQVARLAACVRRPGDGALAKIVAGAESKAGIATAVAAAETPEPSPHTLAVTSWATLHASLQTPLADRLRRIAEKLAETELDAGRLSVERADGTPPAAAQWGDGTADLADVCAISQGGTARFQARAAWTGSPLISESVKPILVALLRN